MPDPALNLILKKPFAEQIAFFRGKLGSLIPTERWDDLWQAEHDRSFMVAGAAKADLLADLYGAVEQSISEGKGIQWFRASFDEIVARYGWSYTGERNWRTRVIYQTNISTSYAAGRLTQLQAGRFPYWLYKHSDSVMHPRPLHVSWSGMVLPADDPWWKTHYPPNGWGCKCRVVGVRNAAGAKRLGGRMVGQAPDDGLNPLTQEPNGIDRGWGYQPGATADEVLIQSIISKQDARPYSISAPLMGAMARDFAENGVLAAWLANPVGDFPLAILSDADMVAIGAQNHTVRFSPYSAAKQAKAHPDITPAEYALAQEVIDRGQRIQDSSTSLLYVLEGSDGYVMVVKTTESGKAVFMTSFRRLSSNQVKRDYELARLMKKGN